MAIKRVFYLEGADRTDLTGTFYPIAHTQLDSITNDLIVRDDFESPADSLRSLNISLDDVRLLAGPNFPRFDEVRSWTPVNTKQPLMDDYCAFGPTEDCALLIRVALDGIVETMDAKLWVATDEEFAQVVELFQRIAARWELFFETVDDQLVTGRTESLAERLGEMVVRL